MGGLPPCSNGGCLLMGVVKTLVHYVLTVARRNILPKNVRSNSTSLLLPKQINSFSSLLSSPPSILAPQYHVTLMLTEYDGLHCFKSIDASYSASLASLSALSRSNTLALLAFSSMLWIINYRASSHSIKTSLLRSRYHPTLFYPPVTIANGQPRPIKVCGTNFAIPPFE